MPLIAHLTIKHTEVKKAILSCTVLLILAMGTHAQNTLPIIKSNTKSVSIRDGHILKPNSWGLDPSAKPDIYHVEIPRVNNKVTFITDQDSISFDTQYGKVYDFVILLNGNDSCYTRISANYSGVSMPIQLKTSAAADTIPFIMRNSRPYVVGKVNGKDNIYMMLDLGAGITCVNINSVKKTAIKFDGKISVTNTNGTNDEPSSSKTVLQMGNLKWENVKVVQVRNLDDEDDMIIGNSLFRDRILEIDYDKKILIVHQQSINVPANYTKHVVQYEQHRPKIKIDLHIADKVFSDWFLFDTGRDGTMLIGEDFTGEFDVWPLFNTIFKLGTKKIVVIPEVKIGSLSFQNIVTNANDPAHPTGKQSLIGNELLQQFNVILDNKTGMMYLKANSLQGALYEKWDNMKYKFYGAIAGIVFMLAALALGIFRFSKRLKNKRGSKV